MKADINILYLLHGHRPYSGIEQTTFNLLKYLDREKFKPIVIMPREGPAKSYLEELGIETYVVPLECDWIPDKQHFYKYLKLTCSRVREFQRIIKERDINIVHTHLPHVLDGAIAAYSANIPHIWHIHDPFEWDYKIFSDYLSPEGFGSLISNLSDAVVSISETVKKTFIDYVPSEKIPVIYNGIDLEKFENYNNTDSNSFRKRLSINKEDILICSVGRVSPEKRFEDFINAAAFVLRKKDNIKFAVVGEFVKPHYAEKLKGLISSLNLNERFILYGPVDDLFSVYRDTDVFVSSSDWEGHSLVCLEAMAFQKPVVATKCGGPEEIVIDGETGYIVNVSSPEELSGAILKLIDAPHKCREMGLRGNERVVTLFSAVQYARNFESLYTKLCLTPRSDGVPFRTEIIINVLSEIADLGLKNIKHEEQIKQLEGFMHRFKDNIFYKGTRQIYHWLQKIEK